MFEAPEFGTSLDPELACSVPKLFLLTLGMSQPILDQNSTLNPTATTIWLHETRNRSIFQVVPEPCWVAAGVILEHFLDHSEAKLGPERNRDNGLVRSGAAEAQNAFLLRNQRSCNG